MLFPWQVLLSLNLTFKIKMIMLLDKENHLVLLLVKISIYNVMDERNFLFLQVVLLVILDMILIFCIPSVLCKFWPFLISWKFLMLIRCQNVSLLLCQIVGKDLSTIHYKDNGLFFIRFTEVATFLWLNDFIFTYMKFHWTKESNFCNFIILMFLVAPIPIVNRLAHKMH